MFSSVLGKPFAVKHTRLSMDRKVQERLIAHGRETLPYEFAALLAGQENRISACYPTVLADPKEDAFFLDGPILLPALKQIHRDGLQWLGVVHTHPTTGAIPSTADYAGWHYPQLSYWILSLAQATPELCAYQLLDDGFASVPYQLLD